MGCAHLPDVGFAEEQSVVGPNKKGLWIQRDLYPSLLAVYLTRSVILPSEQSSPTVPSSHLLRQEDGPVKTRKQGDTM